MRDYTDYIRVMLKKGDRERIREQMKEAGIKNMSAYIRKVATDGHIVKLDLSDVNEVARLLRINANNLNQYAKQANTNGSVYYSNIKTLQKQQDELWQLLKAILDRLSKL